MKKKIIYKIFSVVLLLIMVLAVVCGVAAASGKFVDFSLSNIIRGFCIGIATASVALAWLFYKKSK